MTQLWGAKPEIKITVNDAEEEVQQLGIKPELYRIENGISRVHLTATNQQGRSYLRKFNKFDDMKVYLKYSDIYDSWAQVFGGTVEKLSPTIAAGTGATLQLVSYGYGRAFRNTHCGVDYGRESENSGFDTIDEIISDWLSNRVNKNFDGGNTGYSILGGKIFTIEDPVIEYLRGGYRRNLDILNEALMIYQAYRGASAGAHWYVDIGRYLNLDIIGDHTEQPSSWPTYWKYNLEDSVLTQNKDIIEAQLDKDTEYANKVLLITDIRKPSYDFWTEDTTYGGENMWVTVDMDGVSNENGAGLFVVGSHSLKFDPDGGSFGDAYFPACLLTADAASGQKNVTVANVSFFNVGDTVTLYDGTPDEEIAVVASISGSVLTMVDNLTNTYTQALNAFCLKHLDWNLEKIGSLQNPPTLNFYGYKTGISEGFTIFSFGSYLTNFADEDTFSTYPFNWGYLGSPSVDPDTEWLHKSVPCGPYWKSTQENRINRWRHPNNADWANIDYIKIDIGNASAGGYMLLDDLHLAGKIIREAYNSTAITAYKEHQKIMTMNSAVNDSLKASDDSGTAARLAYHELLRAISLPTRGTVTTPLIVDILPGQLIKIQYDKKPNGTYGVDDTFRVQQIHDVFGKKPITTLTVTNDLTNTFAVGPSKALEDLAKAMFHDPEAKSLKTTGIDTLVERLSVDYA